MAAPLALRHKKPGLEGPDERGEGNPLKRNNETIFSLAHASAGRCVAVSGPIDTHPAMA